MSNENPLARVGVTFTEEQKQVLKPLAQANDLCPDCGEEMQDSYVKDDLVDGVVVSVTRLNCLSCGFETVIYEPEHRS